MKKTIYMLTAAASAAFASVGGAAVAASAVVEQAKDDCVVGEQTDGYLGIIDDRAANSVLVKTALAGADPNWGRIAMALGNSGVSYDPERVSIDVEDVALVRDGIVVSPEAARRARKVMRGDAFTVRIRLGRGRGQATIGGG